VSHHWFTRFFAEYREIVSYEAVTEIEQRRVETQTEEHIDRHFFGQVGMQAFMIAHGIMNPDTKRFDPRRLLGRDETPEFTFYPNATGGRHAKAAGVPGKSVMMSVAINRQTYTVDMTSGCDGYLYGPHVIFNGEHLSTKHDATQLMLKLGIQETFTYQQHLQQFLSTHCLVSMTDKGVQVSESLVAGLEMLKRELIQRGDIEFPVMLAMDQHQTRFTAEAADWCDANSKFIVIWLEEGFCSHWAQSLDKMNKGFHHVSNKLKLEYISLKAQCFGLDESDISLNQEDICTLMRTLWFQWSRPSDVVTSWRNVGVGRGILLPDQIDRKLFFDSSEANQVHTFQRTMPEFLPNDGSVTDVVTLQSHCAKLQQFIMESPTVKGACQADPVTQKKKKSKKLDASGNARKSMTFPEIQKLAQSRRDEEKLKVIVKAEKKTNADAQKASKAKEAILFKNHFDQCKAQRACQDEQCIMSTLIECSACGDIKARECRKQVCVAQKMIVSAPSANPPLKKQSISTGANSLPEIQGNRYVQVHLSST
jgi:hypothetical protein